MGITTLKRSCLAFMGLVTALLLIVYSVHSQGGLQIGYAVVEAGPGDSTGVATALFSSTNTEQVLVWEAGVAAVEPLSQGRIFVEQQGMTRTALALVNGGAETISVTLTLRDATGAEVDQINQDFGAGEHQALFVDELFALESFAGSLTFDTAGEGLGAVTLRQSENVEGEAIFATLPVVDLTAAASLDSIVFPQVGAGEGLSTQVVLLNTSEEAVSGEIQLFDDDGLPLQLDLEGTAGTRFPYAMEGNGTFRGALTSTSAVAVGYAVVTLDTGNRVPSGSAIFQFKTQDAVLSEAGVGAIEPTTLARIFVDNAGTRTGVALASPDNPETTVSFRLLNRTGGELIESTERTLSPQGHLAIFADELFGLPQGFTGLMEITSSAPLVPITLKLTENTRGQPILTTLPIADLTQPSPMASLVFPQLGFGEATGVGTFSTRLIILNTDTGSASNGTLSFFETMTAGEGLVVPLGDELDSQFSFQVSEGGARQFYPGITADLAAIVVDQSNLVVNEGQTVALNIITLDEEGNARDDFDLDFTSLTPETVSIDPAGNITGVSRGFADLVISSGEIVVTVTATVATITAGATGFEVSGIAQDFAGKIYLANTQDHTILLAQQITQVPERWAGVVQTSGLFDDSRLDALFNEPAFLALNQADGNLFVSDGANHVIRQVQPGPQGSVVTLAGSGQLGSQDGGLSQASFRTPQGVALDRQGNLWVVDSGNHTIRRIILDQGLVETVAGEAGLAGSQDGVGSQARFRSPVGITFETEPLAQQLEREALGDPPPPVTMIVADTGNGLIRRVAEDGTVETIGGAVASASAFLDGGAKSQPTRFQLIPLRFNAPSGVVVDSFGNIYVSEPASGRVRAILKTGEVVLAAQTGTFQNPQGLAVTVRGRIVVAESGRSAQEIRYAGPSVQEIEPPRIGSVGGTMVTVKGRNFAPDSLVVAGETLITDARIEDRNTITFVAPPLPSGRLTLTVQHRGGLSQISFVVDTPRVEALQTGEVTTTVGGSAFGGDQGGATQANLGVSPHITFDPAGNLFLADSSSNLIRRVDAVTRIITTVFGDRQNLLSGPVAIAFDEAQNLYIADTGNHLIRRISAADGSLQTVAGSGDVGFSGDGGPADEAKLSSPSGIAVDRGGDLYFTDTLNHRVRKVEASTGLIFTLAGNGETTFSGDMGPATLASLQTPQDVALDGAGNIWVADTGNHAVRRIDPSGTIVTMAGNGQQGFSGDNGAGTNATLSFPTRVTFDSAGDLLIADSGNQRVRKLEVANDIILTVAGNGADAFAGDDGDATLASLSSPIGLAVNAADDLFIADIGNLRIRKVAAAAGTISTFAGDGQPPSNGDDGLATEASLRFPVASVPLSNTDLFIADAQEHTIRKVDATNGVITTVVGTGSGGFSGDGDSRGAALNMPLDLALDPNERLLIADAENNRLREVTFGVGIFEDLGNIKTLAGNGEASFSGDGGAATLATLNYPSGVASDALGNLFVADQRNHRVRRIDVSTGIITTVVGNGQPGFSGDGGAAVDASLAFPADVAVDLDGNLFVADSANHRIRRVDPNGAVSTVAGTGESGFSGDDLEATQASLNWPQSVTVDSVGNLFISDSRNYRVRRVDAITQIITTVAGRGGPGFAGDGGQAVEAVFGRVMGVALDADDNLFIADSPNQRIRTVRGPLE